MSKTSWRDLMIVSGDFHIIPRSKAMRYSAHDRGIMSSPFGNDSDLSDTRATPLRIRIWWTAVQYLGARRSSWKLVVQAGLRPVQESWEFSVSASASIYIAISLDANIQTVRPKNQSVRRNIQSVIMKMFLVRSTRSFKHKLLMLY